MYQEGAVLELLAESLQDVEGLIEGHGHGDLGQILSDILFQQSKEIHI